MWANKPAERHLDLKKLQTQLNWTTGFREYFGSEILQIIEWNGVLAWTGVYFLARERRLYALTQSLIVIQLLTCDLPNKP